VKESLATGQDLRTVVLARGLLDEGEVDDVLDVLAMTGERGRRAARAPR
jgi:aspartate ammonia-lyase